jgi:hypothetical protein
MNLDLIRGKGDVEIIKDWKDGRREYVDVHNTILLTGRRALAQALANSIGDGFSFYVTRMIFGDGGTVDGVKKYVNSNRNGLFGVTAIWKPVISTLDTTVPAQVIFTSSIRFDEGVGLTLNEMALQMHNGDLYSMTTFPDLNKTEDMQITFNWRLNFI